MGARALGRNREKAKEREKENYRKERLHRERKDKAIARVGDGDESGDKD